MSKLYNLMVCYGDRFINVTKDEALFDVEYNRDTLVGAYNAILAYVRTLDDDIE